jgi:hypothetical protein
VMSAAGRLLRASTWPFGTLGMVWCTWHQGYWAGLADCAGPGSDGSCSVNRSNDGRADGGIATAESLGVESGCQRLTSKMSAIVSRTSQELGAVSCVKGAAGIPVGM